MPDYLALRSTSSGARYEWAVAEAKGTRACLTNSRACPQGWSRQVHNVTITFNGNRVRIPRHIVIATRVNPNSSKLRARRLQIRVWNNDEGTQEPYLSGEGAVAIAAANLFGLFRAIGLRENALAIAVSVQRRGERQAKSLFDANSDRARLSDQAEREIQDRITRPAIAPDVESIGLRAIETDLGPIEIQIAEPLFSFARHLRQAEFGDATAEVLRDTDGRLDAWVKRRPRLAEDSESVVLPLGVELRLPREAGRA